MTFHVLHSLIPGSIAQSVLLKYIVKTIFSFLGLRLRDLLLCCQVIPFVSGTGYSGEYTGILLTSQEAFQPRRDFPNSLLRHQCQQNASGFKKREFLIHF